ncbi:MAG: serine/threonine-protein kinase [Myxococcota bacterium]|nr:serine/threonine-protein kinase [Myxococcota bacterium]
MQPEPFGYYTLIERVNVGGMAEIFKACYYREDNEPAFAAIKRILPHLAREQQFVDMFLSEAQMGEHLRHPSIAQVIDQGQERGEYYIALEFVSGQNLLFLRHHLKRRNLFFPPALAVWVIAKVAEALDFAHARCDSSGRPLELIHRDISPQNILISYTGDVKLIDFGIAKAHGRQYQGTEAGVLKGKFSYMAPEQAMAGQVDHRVDLFALGIVFYELLTNERLFHGDSDLATLELVRRTEVTAPSQRAAHISPHIDQIVLRALAREPGSRYQSGAEFAQALYQFLELEAPGFKAEQLQRWMEAEFYEALSRERADDAHYIDQLRAHAAGSAADHQGGYAEGGPYIDPELTVRDGYDLEQAFATTEEGREGPQLAEAVAAPLMQRPHDLYPSPRHEEQPPPQSQSEHLFHEQNTPTLSKKGRGKLKTFFLSICYLLGLTVLVIAGWRVGSMIDPEPTAVVTLSVSPFGEAALSIDGQQRLSGSSWRLELSPGPHLLQVERESFTPWRKEVTLQEGELRLLNARLTPLIQEKVQRISFVTQPAGAQVFVRGQFRALTPITLSEKLSTGSALPVELRYRGEVLRTELRYDPARDESRPLRVYRKFTVTP